MPPLPPTVRSLGWVSFLTDVSSEMIYPLLPSFLVGTLRAGPAFVGLVEGVAESAASLFKLASGWLADRLPRRKPLIVAGYSVSSLARPLVAIAMAPWHVLVIRFVDRVGKGVRGAPRDSLLAEVTPASDLGRAYGFHRAMDNAGAVVGPLLASAILLVRHDLRLVFGLAALPAALSVLVLVTRVREEPSPRASRPREADGVMPPSLGTGGLARYLAVLGIFTLGNSSDAFLLLRAQEAGVSLAFIPLLWTFLHVVKSVASTHGGALSDRVGRKMAIAAGWVVYALAYAGLAIADRPALVWALFGLYGLFHALTEGPERALVAELAPSAARGRAFGLYHALTGGLLLPASLLTGTLWQRLGAETALLTGAGLALAAAVGLALWVPGSSRQSTVDSRQ